MKPNQRYETCTCRRPVPHNSKCLKCEKPINKPDRRLEWAGCEEQRDRG